MRIRSIRPEFFQDKITGALSSDLQIFIVGLWCHADVGGYFEADPQLIASSVFGRKRTFTPKRIAKMLEELVQLRVIEKFRCDYAFYTHKDEVRHDYLYRVIHFGSMQHPHHKEAPKIQVIKIYTDNAAPTPNEHGASPVVSGLRSLVPGPLDPGTGIRSLVSGKSTGGEAPPSPTAVGGSDARAKTGGEGAPPIAPTPPRPGRPLRTGPIRIEDATTIGHPDCFARLDGETDEELDERRESLMQRRRDNP